MTPHFAASNVRFIFNLLASNFGLGASSPAGPTAADWAALAAAVPEPSVVLLAASSVGLSASGRRRRWRN